jgi:hypothetical protein
MIIVDDTFIRYATVVIIVVVATTKQNNYGNDCGDNKESADYCNQNNCPQRE